MAPPHQGDWSDSDDEDFVDVETSVLLGVPDGPVDNDSDLNDVAVSRIGGRPAFLTAAEPPISSSECKACGKTMELLVQMWCPFEDSPMDRALYIWGCSRVGCQGKQGTVRAWRGLRYNEQYAVKLQKKLERQKAKKPQVQVGPVAKVNPFSGYSSSAPNPFGLGAQIFGAPTPPPPILDTLSGATDGDKALADEPDSEDESGDESSSEESLLTAVASVTISESSWRSLPGYSATYLSTATEFLTGQPKPKVPSTAEVVDPVGKDGSWITEAYENSLDTDQVFDRFSQRVQAEPEQCVRYELNGTPLPFASDAVFKKLFPAPEAPPPAVTKAAFTVTPSQKRTYHPTSITPCPVCRSKRVFEVQLMPNLINVLRSKNAQKEKIPDEERKKSLEATLKKGNQDERGAMEWGTCMVFSCERDCCFKDETKEESKYSWREEEVLVQWDT